MNVYVYTFFFSQSLPDSSFRHLFFGLLQKTIPNLSDSGVPLNGIICVVSVIHGLVQVLETLYNVLRILNEGERASFYLGLPNK